MWMSCQWWACKLHLYVFILFVSFHSTFNPGQCIINTSSKVWLNFCLWSPFMSSKFLVKDFPSLISQGLSFLIKLMVTLHSRNAFCISRYFYFIINKFNLTIWYENASDNSILFEKLKHTLWCRYLVVIWSLKTCFCNQ